MRDCLHDATPHDQCVSTVAVHAPQASHCIFCPFTVPFGHWENLIRFVMLERLQNVTTRRGHQSVIAVQVAAIPPHIRDSRHDMTLRYRARNAAHASITEGASTALPIWEVRTNESIQVFHDSTVDHFDLLVQMRDGAKPQRLLEKWSPTLSTPVGEGPPVTRFPAASSAAAGFIAVGAWMDSALEGSASRACGALQLTNDAFSVRVMDYFLGEGSTTFALDILRNLCYRSSGQLASGFQKICQNCSTLAVPYAGYFLIDGGFVDETAVAPLVSEIQRSCIECMHSEPEHGCQRTRSSDLLVLMHALLFQFGHLVQPWALIHGAPLHLVANARFRAVYPWIVYAITIATGLAEHVAGGIIGVTGAQMGGIVDKILELLRRAKESMQRFVALFFLLFFFGLQAHKGTGNAVDLLSYWVVVAVAGLGVFLQEPCCSQLGESLCTFTPELHGRCILGHGLMATGLILGVGLRTFAAAFRPVGGWEFIESVLVMILMGLSKISKGRVSWRWFLILVATLAALVDYPGLRRIGRGIAHFRHSSMAAAFIALSAVLVRTIQGQLSLQSCSLDPGSSAAHSGSVELYDGLGIYTRLVTMSVPMVVRKEQREIKTNYDVVQGRLFGTTHAQTSITINTTEPTELRILSEDELAGPLKRISRLASSVFAAVPMVDTLQHVRTPEQLERILRCTGLQSVTPPPNTEWDEMSSDVAISRMFFFGIGSISLQERQGHFVYDQCRLAELPVRPGFWSYGVRATFDSHPRCRLSFGRVAAAARDYHGPLRVLYRCGNDDFSWQIK